MDEGTEILASILHKDTREFLGVAGLHHIDTKYPELGIWIKKSGHGQKYGREAMHALKDWADRHLDYEYIIYPVDRDNVASRKIPESLGGIVHGEYQKTTPSGSVLNTVEYHIFPTKHSSVRDA